MRITADKLTSYVGKPIGMISGFDIITGEVMSAENKGDAMSVVLFDDDGVNMVTYMLTIDYDKEVDVLVD